MNKMILLGTIALVVLAFSSYKLCAQEKKGENKMIPENAKILVAYYSYSGNTKEVAEAIHEKTGGDLFEIKTEGAYPEEYRPMTVQAKKEIEENYHPKLTTQVADMAQYDVIFLGSPNWWGTITPQVSSFLESYDLSGKTIIPFITNGGGGKQNTIANMTAQCKGCKVEQNGWVGYGSRTMGIGSWLKNFGIKD